VGISHPEIWKVQEEGGVNPPLPRNCDGNETHMKEQVKGKRLEVIGEKTFTLCNL
jgi:hypothetical protein